MASPWIAVAAFFVVAALVAMGLFVAGRLLAVRARIAAPLQGDTYECGEPPAGRTWIQFHARYYVVALVFVLFDVEAALLFPWALQLRHMGMAAVVPGLLFLGILMLGWLYAVRKGALKWQ
jgi:NADH:ubiquinone oxidoreductase subunit 3 (subunit A)